MTAFDIKSKMGSSRTRKAADYGQHKSNEVHSLALIIVFMAMTSPPLVTATCRFPEFLQRNDPWAASYTDGRLVVYVKGSFMHISQLVDNVDTRFTRKCEQRAPDNKYLVLHLEDRKDHQYMCMQFLHRSENIVQMKVSQFSPRQSLELCEERVMALDRWPIVQISQTPEQKIQCPFVGGYNVNMFFPNETAVCVTSAVLMRIESECEKGEGIIFDFRNEACVPASLPRTTKQQVHCIAHWTQKLLNAFIPKGSQTFIILQHAEIHKQTWCFRTSDALSDISGAYLMLDLVCDTGEVITDTRSYFRLSLSRRVYASTCEDEVDSDACLNLAHLCKTQYKRQCSRTCGTCRSESEMGGCTFEEKFRGNWVESSHSGNRVLSVGTYSLNVADQGRYDCLLLESERHKEKKVLVRLDENGCYPRYACMEIDKVASSVIRVRLGDRHDWPLEQAVDRKDHLCKENSFSSRSEKESRFHVVRPFRLLVKDGSDSYVTTAPCGLPPRLQQAIAFREEGKSCSGCLMYQPTIADDRFVVRPHNCTEHHNAAMPPYRVTSLEYHCMASFIFQNNTYAVVTKTNTHHNLGQYLCWVFTSDNQIKVVKAAEAYLFEEGDTVKQEMLEAQFSIVDDDSGRCKKPAMLVTPPAEAHGKTSQRGAPAMPTTTDLPQAEDVTYRISQTDSVSVLGGESLSGSVATPTANAFRTWIVGLVSLALIVLSFFVLNEDFL